MSRHHRAQKWTTHSPKLRQRITRMLPLACIDCGHPVLPTMTFQVGHRRAASRGGRPSTANTGPSHTWCPVCKKRCNQSAGGKLGAAVTNAARVKRTRDRGEIRPW